MKHIEMLYKCAYGRGVGNLQHRTLTELSSFIENVIWLGDEDFKEKYAFDWNKSNAIETWIEKFYEYRMEEEKKEQETFNSIEMPW